MRKYLLIFLIVVIYFNGFAYIRELTEIAIVKTMGVDITEDGEYSISAIVLDTSDEESVDSGIIYNSKGKSIQEAARNMVDISPKKLYIAHMETLVISEDIAKDKMENTLDFFIRDNEGSNSFYLFIAKECKAEDIVNAINEDKIDTVSFLESTQKYKGNANLKTLNDILKDKLAIGTQMCVNSFSLEDKKLKIDNMAYFDQWNLKGFLETEESVLYNMLINQIDNTIISVGEEDDLIVAEIICSNAKMNIDKKNQNFINIDFKCNANITQIGKNIKLNDKNVLEETTAKLNEELNNRIYDFYNKIKNEYKTDILGLGNILYRKNNNLYKEQDYLDKLDIRVKTNAHILSQGGVKKIW